MPSADQIVDVQIAVNSANPTRQSFGSPLFMVYHNVIPDLLKEYVELSELTDDGFHTYDPVYRMATQLKSQNPAPASFWVGKRASAYTQTIYLTPLVNTAGFVYAFTIVDHLGVATDFTYTVTVGQSLSQVVTSMVAAMGTIAGVTITAASTVIHMVSASGQLFNLQNLPSPRYLSIADMTTDPGIVADISAIETVDSISWYGIALDQGGKATIEALAAHVQAETKVYCYQTSDTACTDNTSTTDVAAQLKTSAYSRTFGVYLANELLSYVDCGLLGARLPTDPGASTWTYVTIAGVAADVIGGLATNVNNKNGNTYTILAGENITYPGKVASGEWIDVIVFVDWLKVNIQADIIQAIKAAADRGQKIKFTDKGVDIIRGIVLARLSNGITVGGLAETPAPVVTAPLVKDVPLSDRINRLLPDVEFTANLAGAINTVKVKGTISF